MATDDVLVRRARSGDMDAFEALVERHADVVERVAARIVGRFDADDVTQDVFLRVFHRLDQFRGESPFRAWLLRITHNTALNRIATPQRTVPLEPGDEPLEPERGDRERTPADALEVKERSDRLSLKLLELRPAHRAVLVLRDLEGLSYDEIASVTGTPVGSVKGRLFRARRELIDVLRRNTYDWELPPA